MVTGKGGIDLDAALTDLGAALAQTREAMRRAWEGMQYRVVATSHDVERTIARHQRGVPRGDGRTARQYRAHKRALARADRARKAKVLRP